MTSEIQDSRTNTNDEPVHSIAVLASDMDGTFIPLEACPQNRKDLATLCAELAARNVELVYVTGRHDTLAIDAVKEHSLPAPQWMICDVGASIYRRTGELTYTRLSEFDRQLESIVGTFTLQRMQEMLRDVAELRLQEAEKQSRFKLSYYCDRELVGSLHERLERTIDQCSAPYRIIASVDPFTREGLIDFLPKGVSKDHALRWWVKHRKLRMDSVVFAGDSGNDLAALTAGYRSIVVGNADREIAEHASDSHRASGWTDRLYLAKASATSGVLEGLRYFCGDHDTA